MPYSLLSLEEYLNHLPPTHRFRELPVLLPQLNAERRSPEFWNRLRQTCDEANLSANHVRVACENVLITECARMSIQEFIAAEFGTDSPQAHTLETWRSSNCSDQRTRHLINCLWLETRVQRECWRDICTPFLTLTPGDWDTLQVELSQHIFPAHTSHGLNGPQVDFSPTHPKDVTLGLVDHNLSILKRIYPAADAGGDSDPIRYLRCTMGDPDIRIKWNRTPNPLTRKVLFFWFDETNPCLPPCQQLNLASPVLATELIDRLALHPEWELRPSTITPMIVFELKIPISPCIPTVVDGFSGKIGRFKPSERADRFGRTFPQHGVPPLPEVVHGTDVFKNFSAYICGAPKLVATPDPY